MSVRTQRSWKFCFGPILRSLKKEKTRGVLDPFKVHTSQKKIPLLLPTTLVGSKNQWKGRWIQKSSDTVLTEEMTNILT